MNIEQMAVFNWLKNNPGSTTLMAIGDLDMSGIKLSFIFKELRKMGCLRHEERNENGVRFYLHWAIDKDADE